MVRAFSPHPLRPTYLGRCPRLLWGRAFGAGSHSVSFPSSSLGTHLSSKLQLRKGRYTAAHAFPKRRQAAAVQNASRLFVASLRLCALFLFLACLSLPSAFAQAGRIYTAPDPSATGGLSGHVSQELTHALAVEHDLVRVFRADLDSNGRTFRFDHLPVGKYDLVLFTKLGTVYEGLDLGTAPSLPEPSAKNLNQRITLADGFFNQTHVHRIGISPDGETLLALVERYRANDVLKQSGEALGQMIRRFEVIELARANDDWQMTASRHLYREGEPIPAQPQFRKTLNIPALGSLRVISTLNNMGEITLPKEFPN